MFFDYIWPLLACLDGLTATVGLAVCLLEEDM
jgi:hypothetical protein